MPWFRCRVRGDNFPGSLIGETYPIGFFIMCFVEVRNSADVQQVAMQALRANPKLKIKVPPNTASVVFEEIHEIDESEVPKVQPGIVFYPMKEQS